MYLGKIELEKIKVNFLIGILIYLPFKEQQRAEEKVRKILGKTVMFTLVNEN